jgi:protoheme IX farnesyltransferase
MSMISLFRPPIALMTAASALAGYALHPAPARPAAAAGLFLGVALLAAGASALNQVQERDIDARMERTRRRPVACGRLSPGAGLALAILLAAAALALLAVVAGGKAAGLGSFSLLWYNGVYTPLKRRTPFALLPGALCGALPPLMGWVAAGGEPADHRIVLLAGLLVLWQVPHFWLFALRHREDFAQAGLPTIFGHFTPEQVGRLCRVWTTALTCAVLLLPACGLLRRPGALLLGLIAVAWLAGNAARPRGEPFARLNAALGLLLLAVLVEGLGYL